MHYTCLRKLFILSLFNGRKNEPVRSTIFGAKVSYETKNEGVEHDFFREIWNMTINHTCAIRFILLKKLSYLREYESHVPINHC